MLPAACHGGLDVGGFGGGDDVQRLHRREALSTSTMNFAFIDEVRIRGHGGQMRSRV